MNRLLAIVLALCVSGCGLFFTRGRPQYVSSAGPECTTSKTGVYVDGAISAGATGTALFLGIAALGKEGDLAEGETNKLAYATLFTFLGGVAFAVSGVVGAVKVKGCRDMHDQFRRMNPPRVMPGPPPPPQ